MANANKPSGLSPVKYMNGAPWTGGGQVYCIPSTDGNAYAVGDPVAPAGSADAAGIPTVTLATAGSGNAILGAIVSSAGASIYGASFGVPQESPVVIPATKTRAYYVLVCDDPMVIFEIQEISTGTFAVAADIGSNANLASGTNNGYVSGWVMDDASYTTTAAFQLRLQRLAPKSGNVFGQYAKFWVTINNHSYHASVAGV